MEVNCENYDSRIKAVFPFLWREALFYFCVSRISLGSIESGTLAVVSGTLGYCTLASVPDTLECSRYFASVLDTSECSGYMQVFQVLCKCSGYQREFRIHASVPGTLRVFRVPTSVLDKCECSRYFASVPDRRIPASILDTSFFQLCSRQYSTVL